MMRRSTLVAAAVLWLVLAGCTRPAPPPASATTTTERGPYQLTLAAAPAEALVGDDITLTITVRTPTGTQVTLPVAEELGNLEAVLVDDPPPLPTEAGLTWRRTFRFVPLLSGPLDVPEVRIHYTSAPTENGVIAPAQDLYGGPLRVLVRSVLTAADDPAQPRDVSGTLVPPEPPVAHSPWFWLIAVGGPLLGGLLIGLLAWLLLRWWRRPVPPIAPDVWALAAVDALPLPTEGDRDAARGFYYRLSEIVRLFIEKRFAIAAPEMTTEEFLTTLARSRQPVPFETVGLTDLLHESDIVKFAAALPTRAAAERARATARTFVHAAAAAARHAEAAAQRRDRGELEGAA